jgi:hypothetical protein
MLVELCIALFAALVLQPKVATPAATSNYLSCSRVKRNHYLAVIVVVPA